VLRAGRDDGVVGVVREVPARPVVRDDRAAELRDPRLLGVLRVAGVHRADRGVADVLRRGEVRLARAERHDVAPGRLQRLRLRDQGQRERRRDRADAVADSHAAGSVHAGTRPWSIIGPLMKRPVRTVLFIVLGVVVAALLALFLWLPWNPFEDDAGPLDE